MGVLRLAVAVALLAAAPAQAVDVPAGGGAVLRIEEDPFRLSVREAGREVVGTLAPAAGVRAPGADGPMPVEPLGPAGAFPGLGWVVGAAAGATFPVTFFTGNRLLGAETGGVVTATRVRAVRGDLVELDTTSGAVARLRVRPRPGGGVALAVQGPPGAVSTLLGLRSPRDEALYGLGARKDAFDQRGRLRNVWVEQQNATTDGPDRAAAPVVGEEYTFPNGGQAAYFVQPALLGSRGWAAWSDDTVLHRLDLAASRDDAVRWGVASPDATFSLAAGGLEGASRAYTAAVGRAPAPPRYVFEPWIDVINEGEGEAAPNGARFDGGPRVRRDLDEIAERSKVLGLPIGLLGVEGWHKVADAEGPEARAYFAGLRRAGFRLAAYWNPFTAPGSRAYDEALREGLFIRDETGAPYPIVTNRNNVSYVIDFTHPGARAFWKRQLDRSADLGFEAFMEDFGELVTEGMRLHDGRRALDGHNAYPDAYHAAGRAAIDAQARERPGFEPWFYVRAGFTGTTASTTGVFPGDETTDWTPGSGIPSVVPAMLNLALTGGSAFTTDVGGYLDLVAPRTSPELLARWSQLAALTPIMRIHNSTGKGTLFPWEAGDEALDAYRRYARLKVRLVPLVDRWSRRHAADGTIGPVRPLVLDDPALRHVRDQWLLGRDVLVAPVLRPGARERRVALPAGERWQQVRVAEDGSWRPVGDPVPGGRTITAAAPFGDIPVFLRDVRLALVRRCVGGRRLRVEVRGETGSVVSSALKLRRTTFHRGLRRTIRVRGRVLRAVLRLEDGRVVRLRRDVPSCAPVQG
jgi:sulfoquinovosidase